MADRAKHLEEPAAVAKATEQKPNRTQQAHGGAAGPVLQPRSVGVPPGLSRPANVQMLQQTAGNRAVMRLLAAQRSGAVKGHREPTDEEIRSAAEEGIRTPATTLPYFDRIQGSFGRHSIGHVKAHVGLEAAQASQAMNALAFASGEHVVFGGTPDLRTAAHEAAHIVQQQAGVQLSGGIGREGDAYERHAEAVAEAVAQGNSAEPLLSLGSRGAASTGPLNRVLQRSSGKEKMSGLDKDDEEEHKSIDLGSDPPDTNDYANQVSPDLYKFPLIINVSSALKRLQGFSRLEYTEKLNICRSWRSSDKEMKKVWSLAIDLYDKRPKKDAQAKRELEKTIKAKGWNGWPGLSEALNRSGLPNLNPRLQSLRDKYEQLELEANKLGVFQKYKERCLLPRKENPNYVKDVSTSERWWYDTKWADAEVEKLETAIAEARSGKLCSMF